MGAFLQQQLNEDEIQTVISALLNKEYLLLANSSGKEQELEFGLETKEKYLQTATPKKLSESYISGRFDLPHLHPIISVEEENSELCEILDEMGEWNFDSL